MRALTPSNIVAGFRKCGVHPFNRNAIMNLDPVDTDSSDGTSPTSNNSTTNSADGIGATVAKSPPVNAIVSRSTSPAVVAKFPVTTNTDSDIVFPPVKLELFERRYKEGYDIPDAEYEAWLTMAHPQAGMTSIADAFQDVPTLNPVSESDDEILAYETPVSSPEMFSTPVSPSHVPLSADDNDAQSQTLEVPLSHQTPAPDNIVTEVASDASASEASASHASSSGSTTPSQGNSFTTTKVSPLAKYLTLPDATPKSRTRTPETTKIRAMTGARVLTSTECFAIIKEQEQKKKQKEEEKIRRKKEREEKKQQRLEEQQKKTEQKAKRVKEMARKAEEKLREKERKRVEKEQKQKEKAEQRGKPKNAESGNHKRTLRSRCVQEDHSTRLDDVIESNKCCVCYEEYEEEEEMEWVQCPCSRWLHEECIIETRVDTFGKELLCHHCV